MMLFRAINLTPVSSCHKKRAFTLIELLVVIAIIGVLSTLVIVSLGNSRVGARDAKRLNDLKAMANALELYYADNNAYPEADNFSPGATFEAGGVVYMSKVPNNPTPRTDGDCPDEEYRYVFNNINHYSIIICLGSSVQDLQSGGIVIESGGSIKSVGSVNGLVGWWRFNEGAGSSVIDSSSYGHSSLLINSPTWTNDSPFNEGYSMSFNGTNQYITASYAPHLNLTNGYTLATWVKLNNIHTARILGQGPTNDDHRIWMPEWSQIQYPYFNYGFSGGRQMGFSALSNHIGIWLHFTGTAEPGGFKRIYLNGVKVAQVNNAYGLSLTDSNPILYIGAANATSYLNGSMDDVRVYNRALSEEEVMQLYLLGQ